MWTEFIGRLDEIIGAGMLTVLVALAMFLGYDHGLAQAGITGIVALLAVKVTKQGGAANNDRRETKESPA